MLPPSGPLIQALARFDPFPTIDGPQAEVPPPNSRIARDPDVRRAAGSVVKVLGTACGLGVQGSGWIARDGVVVTNAHVVAGQDDTTVQLGGEGDRVDAQAIWFDSRNDLAILRAPGLGGVRALRLNPGADEGDSAAILGFPENGPYDVRPGRLGHTSTVVTQDAYGRGPVERSITSLRGAGALRQLRRPDGGRLRASRDDDLRGVPVRRRACRIRRSGGDRARRARPRRRSGRNRPVRVKLRLPRR